MQETQSVTLSGAGSQSVPVRSQTAGVGGSQVRQGAVKQQAVPVEGSGSNEIEVSGSTASKNNSAFNMQIEDAYYRFRKDIQGALEVGIQEALEVEKATMFSRLNEQARRVETLEADVARLRAENDALHLQVSQKAESQARMALLIAELKDYRRDCLLGQRCLHRWNVVARHGARHQTYVALITAQHRRALARQVLALWKDKYVHQLAERVADDAKKEVKALKEEREDFFADERAKYEAQIEALKKELQGFAVKERKMKDAMKQAFLNGINAISEQATVALDRTDRMAMDKRLQEELERQYVAGGGDPRQVQITSPPSDGFQGATQAAFAQEELALDEAYGQGPAGHDQGQARVLASSPARPLAQHRPGYGGPLQTPTPPGFPSGPGAPQGPLGIAVPDQIGPVASVSRTSLPRPEPQVQRVPERTVAGVVPETGSSLAARLRAAGRAQAKSSGNVYRESLKNINLRVEKE